MFQKFERNFFDQVAIDAKNVLTFEKHHPYGHTVLTSKMHEGNQKFTFNELKVALGLKKQC